MAHVTLPGLNWRNLNPLEEDAFAIFEAGGFQCAVVMSNMGPELPLEIARRKPAALLIGRLFRGGGSLPTVKEALAEWRPYVYVTRGVIKLYAIDNEPDEHYPGVSPEDFCVWWVKVRKALQWEFNDCYFGFPMPSVRGQQSVDYMRRCVKGIEAADWLAERGYWYEPWQMTDWHWGARYILTSVEFSGKRIHLCEYGCSADLDQATRADQYRAYLGALPSFVQTASAYIMAGGTPDWKRFWIDAGMAQAMRINHDSGYVTLPEGGTMLKDQYPDLYAQWEAAGGVENNLRAHLLGIGVLKATPADLKFLADEADASITQLRAALKAFPFP